MPGAILREQELLYTLYFSTCKLYMQAPIDFTRQYQKV